MSQYAPFRIIMENLNVFVVAEAYVEENGGILKSITFRYPTIV